MMLDEGVSTLIGRIYEGARDPAVWDRALDGLLERTDSRVVFVSAVDLAAGGFSQTRFYGADNARFLDGVTEYEAGFYRQDPTLLYGRRNPAAGFVTLRKAIEGANVPYADHPYVKWVAGTLGSGNCMIRYTPPVDDLVLGVSLHPSVARGCHDRADIQLFGLLFAHVEGAMRLAARPPDFFEGDEARLLLDKRGKIRAATDAARELLGKSDGLRIVDGAIVADRPRDATRIDALIASALGAVTDGSVGGNMVVPRPSGQRGWLLTASPMPNPPSPFEAFCPAVLLRIVDPDARPSQAASTAWADFYGLTPSEVRLAETLLAGECNLRQAAHTIGIAHATARVHLAHLFEKTGVRSQAQLARLLTRAGC
jgi:DNA-binding CsgD family transcriptional regulator